MKTANPMRQKEMTPFRILLAGLIGIGISFVLGQYFNPDEKISRLALMSAVGGVGLTLITFYFFYRKNNGPVFGKKPFGEISLTKRLFGVIGISGFACVATGVVTSLFFEPIGVGEGAFFGGFMGISTSCMVCGGWEFWNRFFPNQASKSLNKMFPKKPATFRERINRID